MITLAEYLTTRTLFGKIAPLVGGDFVEMDGDDMDALLSLRFGERCLYEKFNDMETEKVARLLALNFGEVWRKYESLDTLPLTGNYEKVKDNFTGTVDNEENETGLNKVSAYNDPSLLTDSGNEHERAGTVETENERIVTRESTRASDYAQLYNLASSSIVNRVLYDVASFLTLEIY